MPCVELGDDIINLVDKFIETFHKMVEYNLLSVTSDDPEVVGDYKERIEVFMVQLKNHYQAINGLINQKHPGCLVTFRID